ERRDRRLDLVRPRALPRERPLEGTPALLDLLEVPERAVLVGEKDELTLRREPCGAAGVLQEKQRVQPVRLRLVRHEGREDGGQPDRLRAELGPHGRPVAGVEDEIDRREHGPQPLRQEVLGWHAERDAGVADLPLRPYEPLRERRLREDEGARDLRRREAADEAQGQGDLRLRGERRMTAGEDQLEALVGNRRLLVLRELLGSGQELRLAGERLVAADAVDRAVARRRDDPGSRVGREAVSRPPFGGAKERLLYRVLGEIEIAEDAAEDRDRARTLVAVGAGQLLYEATSASRITTGRTSMRP